MIGFVGAACVVRCSSRISHLIERPYVADVPYPLVQADAYAAPHLTPALERM